MQEQDKSNPSKYLVFVQDKRYAFCSIQHNFSLLCTCTSIYLSSNGTFINGEKIGMFVAMNVFVSSLWIICAIVYMYVGRNKKRVLNHDDEISLATKKNKGKLYCTKGLLKAAR